MSEAYVTLRAELLERALIACFHESLSLINCASVLPDSGAAARTRRDECAKVIAAIRGHATIEIVYDAPTFGAINAALRSHPNYKPTMEANPT